jgi:hypothetical protein
LPKLERAVRRWEARRRGAEEHRPPCPRPKRPTVDDRRTAPARSSP